MPPNQPEIPLDNSEENNYIVSPLRIPELFAKKECEEIIKYSLSLPKADGYVARSGDPYIDREERVSNIKWVHINPESNWIFERIRIAIDQANQKYKFDINDCNYLQVTEYQPGGHYVWHEDIGEGEYSKRKLSMSVQLSKCDDYEGGDLEFMGRNIPDSIKLEYRQKGTAIIFPSYISHRISQITSGTRWSLIAWFNGPPFR